MKCLSCHGLCKLAHDVWRARYRGRMVPSLQRRFYVLHTIIFMPKAVIKEKFVKEKIAIWTLHMCHPSISPLI
ncbi:MAG: hypothetical protein JSC085_000985 [Candidatus Tokpelaia sp. JSC085]|nr:MAG: hypothetical protein JSC085_000985 [Candidatus Tokpelaia sp. JSC085]